MVLERHTWRCSAIRGIICCVMETRRWKERHGVVIMYGKVQLACLEPWLHSWPEQGSSRLCSCPDLCCRISWCIPKAPRLGRWGQSPEWHSWRGVWCCEKQLLRLGSGGPEGTGASPFVSPCWDSAAAAQSQRPVATARAPGFLQDRVTPW